MAYRARRVDGNQKEVVAELRKKGYSVAMTHEVGKGFPDFVVGFQNNVGSRRNILIELKDPDQPPSGRKLTPAEYKFHQDWLGQVDIAWTVADIVKVISRYNQ